MDKRSLDEINKFCDKQKDTVSQYERDFMWRRFSESYFAMREKKEKGGNIIIQQELDTIIDTLLDEKSLENNLTTARGYYGKLESQFYDNFKKNTDKTSFIHSLGTSILANVIYSILLIFIFWIAKDQINTWLLSLKK